jgi:hypothetical protein
MGCGGGAEGSAWYSFSPGDLADYEQDIAEARAAIGEEAFAAAWEQGRAMSLEQVVAYALEEDEDSAQ